jgi:TIR domain
MTTESPVATAPPLRVFISYKEKDETAAARIQAVLRRIGNDKIHVFVSGIEKEGTDFRKSVLEELRTAHILILLYTDPQEHWDWCLYETGYFDGRQDPNEVDRRLYVLHRREDPPSGPFLGLRTVEIDASLTGRNDDSLKRFLKTVFVESTSPAVNSNWDAGGGADLLDAFTAPFCGRKVIAPAQDYVQRLTFRVKRGPESETKLIAGQVPSETEVIGTKRSFGLFGFATSKAREWRELERSWRGRVSTAWNGNSSTDSVTLWVQNLADKMLAAMRGEEFDDGLPLFYCHFVNARARALFRPALARMNEYTDVYEFEVVFVEVPPELAGASAGPLTTVGSLLRLAHMFRFGWIEPTTRDVVNSVPAGIPDVARTADRRLNSITAESWNQGIRTEDAVLLAFAKGSDLQTQVKQAIECWQNKVAPAFQRGVEGRDTSALLEALGKASEVNWQFHRACAQRYLEIVDEHLDKGTGPLDPV